MDMILENLIEDATRVSQDFCKLADDTQHFYSELWCELDTYGCEIQKSIDNVKNVKKYLEEYYDIR